MKKVYDKTAWGVVMLAYFNILLLIQILAGLEIWSNIKTILFLSLCGLPVAFIVGNKLSKGYNKYNNHDTLFNIIGIALVCSFAILSFINKYL
jgi:hypothetical protein